MKFSSPSNPKNERLLRFARCEMGSKVKIDDASRDFGRPSIVWRLTGGDGSSAWLKHHESGKLYRRELLGLEVIVPSLGEQTWWSSPTMISKNDEIEAVLMTGIDGDLLETASASHDEQKEMYRLAGRFSQMLHAVDLAAPDGLDAASHLRTSLEHYLNAGLGHVDKRTVNWARALIDRACLVGVAGRVPCHMDYSPRNWLADRGGGRIKFGVIDWERARWDLWLQDVHRMEYDHWHREPQLRVAYFEGYGRRPTNDEQLQADAMCAVSSIASIPWAIEHGDERFASLSRKMLDRVISSADSGGT